MPPEPIPIIACMIWKPASLRVVPGVEEREEAGAPVGLDPDRERADGARDQDRKGEQARGGARDEKHGAEHEDQGDRGAEIGLGEEKQGDTGRRGAPTGRASCLSVRGAGRRERYAATHTASASLASSEGWNTAGPTAIHRRAPLTAGPITSTAARRPSETTTRIGASVRSRR